MVLWKEYKHRCQPSENVTCCTVFFFNRASQMEALRWCNRTPCPQAQSYRNHIKLLCPFFASNHVAQIVCHGEEWVRPHPRVLMVQVVHTTESQIAQILLMGAALTRQGLLTLSKGTFRSRLWGCHGVLHPRLGYRSVQVTAPDTAGFFPGKREQASRGKHQATVQFWPINII